jgi:hypothetical protein
MRDYALWVPEDAVAAELKRRSRAALDIMAAHWGPRSHRPINCVQWRGSSNSTGRAYGRIAIKR